MRCMTVLALAAALALFGCAPKEPDAGAADAAAPDRFARGEEALSSFALIELAMSEGRIDYSEGMLYKTYALFDRMSLPPEYESDVPAKSGTAVILEIQRNWHRLLPEHRAEISQYIEPIGRQDDDTSLDDVTPERLEDERQRID